MTELVDSSIAQYAVIEARRTEGPSEPFVIAYPDEESLRDLIAGPSIIACGFATRKGGSSKGRRWLLDRRRLGTNLQRTYCRRS